LVQACLAKLAGNKTMKSLAALLLISTLGPAMGDGHGHPCDCDPANRGNWTYSSESVDAAHRVEYYGSCTATYDWSHTPWCYVVGGSMCIHASPSSVPGESRYYKKCSPCNCRGHWQYKEIEASGCTDDTEWDPWCQVQGSRANCDVAMESDTEGMNDWKYCKVCKCMNQWNYKGKMQHGCWANDPDYDKAWCYVEGYEHCDHSTKSEVEGEHRHFMHCGDTHMKSCKGAKAAYKMSECCKHPEPDKKMMKM
jgi:hypothetical protein